MYRVAIFFLGKLMSGEALKQMYDCDTVVDPHCSIRNRILIKYE